MNLANTGQNKMTELKVGDVLTSSWGYDQTNVDFYQVIKTTKTMVTLQQIEGTVVSSSDHRNKVMPVLNKPLAYWNNEPEKPVRRKINSCRDGEIYVKISSCQYARLWNGQPKYETNSLSGH